MLEFRHIRSRMALLPLIFLLMIQGVYSADDGWGVNYSSSSICALKGSTVIINCTYEYPTGHQIMKVFWTNTDVRQPNNDFPDLSEDSEYSQRIQYLGVKHHDCTMRLTDVRQTDSHEYYFRLTTYKPDGKWIGAPGVTLNITDLQLESSGERVIEGHSVTLTCKSRCSLTDRSTFIWFKNTQSLSERTDRNNQLILQSVRREDTGNYSCAVQGHNLTSTHQYINVIYAPDKPVISVNPSGEIKEGDSVNLTCSSDANPPAEISWFKGETSVASGQTYIISKIRSDHSGEYKCKSINELGHKYSAVTLNVSYPPKKVTASIIGSGEIMEGDSVTLTCSSESNPPVHNYTWFKVNKTSSVGSGQTYSITNINSSHSGWFYCEAQNEVGSQRSVAVSVTVLHSYYNLLLGITLGCGALFIVIIIIILFIMRKQKDAKTEDTVGNQQGDLYCNVHASESAHCEDHYSSVTPKGHRTDQTSAGKTPESGDPEEIQYASVHHHATKEMKSSEEIDNTYDNIRNYKPDAAVRSNVEETSVIYSSVK
ncbi:B-cell receptor CD22 isoform X2 [Misgurnus anguillicaudatus]|uniref:B-cell receptor CD22 isoform X2 n=1 Tax=Misgurnus anguillicaudatus TaxID=75329 RepID=UPI003CCFBAFF